MYQQQNAVKQTTLRYVYSFKGYCQKTSGAGQWCITSCIAYWTGEVHREVTCWTTAPVDANLVIPLSSVAQLVASCH